MSRVVFLLLSVHLLMAAADDPSVFTITEKAPPTYHRAFSWLKAPTSVFTFKTILRLYDKQA